MEFYQTVCIDKLVGVLVYYVDDMQDDMGNGVLPLLTESPHSRCSLCVELEVPICGKSSCLYGGVFEADEDTRMTTMRETLIHTLVVHRPRGYIRNTRDANQTATLVRD